MVLMEKYGLTTPNGKLKRFSDVCPPNLNLLTTPNGKLKHHFLVNLNWLKETYYP